ncbi:MAG: type VI secretion system baseplate subunit TssK [Methylobacter sp.]|nr:MAG: type VI secretion system baseplate subunit TssK [Methylobacter sp.]
MNSTAKILWGEGLLLRPQHFQQQDQYHESRLNAVAKALQPYHWGVLNLKCDEDALVNNTLRLLELTLIFQDGEIVKAPSQDDLPDAVDLSGIPLSQQTVSFYIGLPLLKNFSGNSTASTDTAPAARYVQTNADAPDLFTHAVDAELNYLKKAIRLVSEHDTRDSLVSFPLVRLRRISTGGFELDPQFVPPSLSIRSSALLFLQLRRLLDALQAKVNALYGHHREPSKHVIEFRSGDISSFWLLHTASAAFAGLSHYLHHPDLHPERLFEQLLNLAGALLTYSRTLVLSDLPIYQHDDPGPCFSKIHSIIRELLDTVISAKYFAIALNEIKPSYHYGMLDSGKINSETNLYIAVAATMPALELVEAIPLRFKAGAPDDVDKFVLSAMPGLKLVHSPQVPSAVPVRPDTFYFLLEAKGPLYDRMLQAQAISIYVPSGIPDLKLELMAVSS